MNPTDNSLDQGYDASSYNSSLEAKFGTGQAAHGGGRLSAFKFNKSAFMITFIVMVVIGIVGGAALVVKLFHNDAKNNTSLSSNQLSNQYSVGSNNLSLQQINGSDELQLGQASQLLVNGELTVSKSLVLSPSSTPSSPVTGQIYYSQSNNAPYYFDGSKFISLEPTAIPEYVTSLGGSAGLIGLGNGLTVTGGKLSISSSLLQSIASSAGVSTPKVNSLQGLTGNVTLNAGNGIAISGTTITNSGVVGLTSSDSSVDVTNQGNGVYDLKVVQGGPGATAVTLDPLVAQPDTNNSGLSSINISKTNGSGDFAEFSNNGVDAFVVNDAGQITSGTINESQVQGLPATFVSSVNGANGAVNFTAGSGISIVGTAISNTGVTSLTGTANEVNVSSAAGAVTLSLPQTIDSGSTPTFAGLNLAGNLALQQVSTIGAVANPNANAAGYGVSLSAGAANGSTVGNNGGSLGLNGGAAAGSGNNTGGNVNINGGLGTGTASGGSVNINTGASTGAINIGSTNAGNVNITSGSVVSIQGGNGVNLESISGANSTILDFAAPSGGSNTITLPAATGTVCLDNSLTCGFATSSASGNYIQNLEPSQGISKVQSANFYIQSNDAATNPTAAIADASGQTGDLLDFQNNSGTKLASFDYQGNLSAVGGTFGGTLTVASTITTNTNLSITPASNKTLTIGLNGAGQSTTIQGNAVSFVSGSGANANTFSFGTSTEVAGQPYTLCDTSKNCVGIGGGVSAIGTTNTNFIPIFNGSQQITDSIISQDSVASPTQVTVGANLLVNGNTSGGLTVMGANSAPNTTNLAIIKAGTGSSANLLQLEQNDGTSLVSVDSTGLLSANFGLTAQGSTINLNNNSNNDTDINTGTSNGAVNIGNSSTGSVVLQGNNSSSFKAYSGGNSTTLSFDPIAGAANVKIPNVSGDLCVQTSPGVSNCSLAPSSGSSFYIQNLEPSQGISKVQSANFYIQSNDAATNPTAAIADASGQTGDLLDFQNNSGTKLASFDYQGNLSAVGGTFGGTLTVASTITTNTNLSITPASNKTLTIGLNGAGQSTTIQGNAVSFVSGSGANANTFSFGTSTEVAGQPYTLCDTSKNCVGIGGGVSAIGTTNTNFIPIFNGSQQITDSIISQDSVASPTQVTVGANLLVNGNISGSGALTVSSTGGSNALTLTSGSGTLLLGAGTGTIEHDSTPLTINVSSPTTSALNVVNSQIGQVANISATGTISAGTGQGLYIGASNINTGGTLNNVAYLNQGNTFSASNNTFSGTINNQTISSTGNFTGTLSIQGGTVGGAGTNSLSLGKSATNSGGITFYNHNGANTITLAASDNNPASSITLTLPTSITGTTGDCLINNGITGSTADLEFSSCTAGALGEAGATSGYIPLFSSPTTTLVNSLLNQSGSTISMGTSSTLNVQGTLALGLNGATNNPGTLQFFDGDSSSPGNKVTVQAPTLAGSYTLQLPNSSISTGACVEFTTVSAGVLGFTTGSCAAGGTGGNISASGAAAATNYLQYVNGYNSGTGQYTSTQSILSENANGIGDNTNALSGSVLTVGSSNDFNVTDGGELEIGNTAGSPLTLNTNGNISNVGTLSGSGLISTSAGGQGLTVSGSPTNTSTQSLVQLGGAIGSGNNSSNGGTGSTLWLIEI